MVASGKKGVIGILTGGGDVPGLNPAIRAVTIRALREGYSVIGLRRGWAGLVDTVRDPEYDNSDNYQILTEELVNRAGRTGGTFLHSSRTNPSKVSKASVPKHLQDTYSCREERSDARSPEEPRVARHREPDPDRRRRHPELWRAPVPGRRESRCHPQDHGQRRSGNRLLHRIQHLRHPHHRNDQSTAHFGRLARTLHGAGSLWDATPVSPPCCRPWLGRPTAASYRSTSSTSSG